MNGIWTGREGSMALDTFPSEPEAFEFMDMEMGRYLNRIVYWTKEDGPE